LIGADYAQKTNDAREEEGLFLHKSGLLSM
jgi:hypothetical protein